MKEFWNQPPSENFGVNVQQAWEQSRYRNQRNAIPVTSDNFNPRGRLYMPLYLFRTAAVLLVAFFTGLFLYSQMSTTEQTEPQATSAFNVLQESKSGVVDINEDSDYVF